ncbi:septal ring lytic transglycosylase RlpA family protein [Pelotalea chapellei]|uniref:Septal ring lytic transglycosylase RlpA family protein n=1 Tax=Pelotalea chapellei TaxID=44671 RepID=A0ABS5U9B9_9BACT|nr:septal ring lytic transglycosylase RlpA family protein [Pelotalea chapellei]MBT1072250.1 septal ring lytic transglycosylase RlpA family protein [Pelotalea chapellei]
MNVNFIGKKLCAVLACTLAFSAAAANAELLTVDDQLAESSDALLNELTNPPDSPLEELITKSSPREAKRGYASYYASRFTGKRTTSGHRYRPEKMTAAHHNLPLGTVVRVINPATSQAVEVTVNDRCAAKPFPFIDLSRAAAQKIGLLGKGKIKVVIVPLLDGSEEEPA